MVRIVWLSLVVLASLLGNLLAQGKPSNSKATRPNILFIVSDQQRWDCVGANGNRLIKTPSMDRLAAAGANFTHMFVNAPVCVPSRASFFTGRYPHSHRNRVNYTPLSKSEVLMQARLKKAGYSTASVGKLHLWPPTVLEAKQTGFDHVELHDAVRNLDRFSDYAQWRKANDPNADSFYYRKLAKDIEPGKNPFRAAIDDKYSETTWVGQRTRHYLKKTLCRRPTVLFVQLVLEATFTV